jgi:hypothetical protein
LPYRKYTRVHTFKVSKIIQAPIGFVYDWCTDFQEGDPQLIGSKTERTILSREKNRAVYLSQYAEHGKPKSAVNVVTLYPGKAWHLDNVGDDEDHEVDDVLARLGPNKETTRCFFTEHFKIQGGSSKAQATKIVSEVWDKYVAVLERDYAHRK